MKKKDAKKKIRPGRIFSIIISSIIFYLSLQPIEGKMFVLIPLSILAWLCYLGRKNVFDFRYTEGTHYDAYAEKEVDDTEGGLIAHCVGAAFVFVPLGLLDAFIDYGHGIQTLYWLVPVVLIIMNIITDPVNDDNDDEVAELTVEQIMAFADDDKPTNFKDIEVVKVEGAGSQYYFDFHSQSLILYDILSYDIYKIEGNTIKNKLYHIAGERKNESLSMTNKDGNLVGLSNNIYNIPTRNNHEIAIDGKIKYKIIDNTSTAPYDNYIITDPDGNKLAYYQIIDTDILKRKNIYGPNDEPYVTWSDDKTFSVMESCPIDDKSVILMIASVLSDSAVQVL